MSTESNSSTKKKAPPKPERRKTPRNILYTRYPVTVRLAQESGAPSENHHAFEAAGVLTDITRAGMGIIIDRPLITGARISIELSVEHGNKRQLVATVIWKNPLPTTHTVLKEPVPSTAMAADADPGIEFSSLDFWRIGIRLDENVSGQKEFVETLLAKKRRS